jgi:hypothetical protein
LETKPGPSGSDPETFRVTAFGGESPHGAEALTLERIRTALEELVCHREATDPALFYFDGRRLSVAADETAGFLFDGIHPGDAGSGLIATRFANWARAKAALVQGQAAARSGGAHELHS